MDPVELLELCRRGGVEGAPSDIIVPNVFSASEFEATWAKDPKRVRKLLDELLCGQHADEGLELLMKSGALHALVPELVAIKNLGDDPAASMHKDVWDHTKQVVMGVVPVLELRWGSLFHDIGKATTRRFDGRKVTFHNHDIVGAKMLDRMQKRMKLFQGDDVLFITVRMLVLNHLRPAGYKKTWSDSGVRRLLTDLGGMHNFERLMTLSRADLTTKNPNKRERALARGRELEERVRQVFACDNAPKLPKGTMGVIMSKVAAKPGPWLNDVREELEHMMKVGVLPPDKDVSYYVMEGLKLVGTHISVKV